MLACIPSVKKCSLRLNCMEYERNEVWMTTQLKDNLNSFSTDQKQAKLTTFLFCFISTQIFTAVCKVIPHLNEE